MNSINPITSRVSGRHRRPVISSRSRSRTERDREALRQQIIHGSSPSPVRSGIGGVWGRVQEPTASPSSVLESGNRGVWGRVQDPTTASQGQWRSVDNRELSALTFTFGDEVGNFLADTIRVGEGGIETISKTEISLPPDYRPKELSWLGYFIHGATRIWQQHTGRYNSVARGAVYRHRQLRSSNLDSGQHAEAVKQWFYINYGDAYDLIGTGPHQMSLNRLRTIILGDVDREVTPRSRLRSRTRGRGIADLRQIVNDRHGWIIDEIRDPNLLPQTTRIHQVKASSQGTLTPEDIMRGEEPRIRYRSNDRMRRRLV